MFNCKSPSIWASFIPTTIEKQNNLTSHTLTVITRDLTVAVSCQETITSTYKVGLKSLTVIKAKKHSFDKILPLDPCCS